MNIYDDEQPHLYTEVEEESPPTIYKSRYRRRRWLKYLKWTGIGVLVVLVALSIWGYVWLKGKENKMKLPAVAASLDKSRSGQPNTTLIMGVDKGSVPGEAESRADILMLLTVNASGTKSAVISIPRDTRVKIAGHGTQKINAAHAFGGQQLMIDTVRDFTGLPINHFVEIDFQGFKDIVNAMGGVKMHIDKAIHDKYAGDVPAGDVVLNGDQALALVRARHDVSAVPAGDLDRVKNQRKFLNAMLSTLSHQRNPFKAMSVVDAVSKDVKTDLSFWQMLSLGRRLKGGNLEMSTVPGTPKTVGGLWYYVADMEAFKQMLSTFESKQEVSPDQTTQQSSDTSGRSSVRVAVLNGSGVNGLAKKVADKLARKGYQVGTGNAAEKYSRTTIYYSGSDSSKAGMVAADLTGARQPTLASSSDIPAAYAAQVVVVLGSDYGQ
jgi:polyisoprenyl-teichoic acid--peptidoglycan teichoic acid transferase